MKLALVLLVACGSNVAVKPTEDRIDAIGRRYHEAGTFDGVIAVRAHGQLTHVSAFGDATRDQVFPYASITKQVAAVLVMQEVAAGRLSLDAPVHGSVTLRQLLQHTSGMGDPEAGTPDGHLPAFYLRSHVGTAHEEADACWALPASEAGAFHYNNCDYIVIGALLEQTTGQSFAALVHARIANKLGLRSWGVFGVDVPPATLARGHGDQGEVAPEVNHATYGAAGALFGNATDLSVFAQALLDGTLLDAKASAELFRGDPKVQMEALGSWQYELDLDGRKLDLVERQGDIAGIRAISLFSRTDGFTIAVLANTERAPLFDLWAKKGLSYDLVEAVAQAK
ncbi:MAG: serine hydrolase domain-containing protein [Kofleriaceae bacterium]